MAYAIQLAKQAFNTYPNPRVGAVLTIDDKIVASGYHHGPGQPHAEIECLREAQKLGLDLTHATLIVTLEPCKHFGKTPPCTSAILNAGIKNLVVGALDPNPIAQGGAQYLKEQGLNVTTGILENECQELIADFRTWQTKNRPYLTLKLAATLDGRIATRTGHSQWITSHIARADVHNLRAHIGQRSGAILIGGQTFRLDNPKLTARVAGVTSQPYAIVITSKLPDISNPWHLISERPNETIFFTLAENLFTDTAKKLLAHGIRLYPQPKQNDQTDFKELLKNILEELHTPEILCEGGGKLALSLLSQDVVDKFILYLSPMILGDNLAKPLFDGLTPKTIDQALRLKISKTEMFEPDLKITLTHI